MRGATGRTARRGKNADVPVNQPSNSTGEMCTVSTSRGSIIGSECCDAIPGIVVVADTTPDSESQLANDECVTPLG